MEHSLSISEQKNNYIDLVNSYIAALPMPRLCESLGLDLVNDKILCPVHAENEPSCHVYDNHCFCFGCGAYIGPVKLIMNVQGCGYTEGIRWYASEAGFPEPDLNGDNYNSIQNTTTAYQLVYEMSLKRPEEAIAYLESRGIRRETVEGRVGFIYGGPEPDDKMRANGFVSKKGNFLFSNRLVIPITRLGEIVSLYGRALDSDRIPTHIYPGRTDPPMPAALWNLDQCWGKKEIFLCESIIDALTLVDKGYPAVGLFGTQGMTAERTKLLSNSGIKKINIVFDSDANGSGQTAALKVGDKLFKANFKVSVISLPLPEGSSKVDVNSYFQDHSSSDFKALLAKDFFQSLVDTIPTQGDVQAQYDAILPIIKLVSSQPELTWKSYAARIHQVVPDYPVPKITEAVRKEEQAVKEAKSKKFRPLLYAKRIIKQCPVIFCNGSFYKYDDGVYGYWYPEELDKTITGLLGADALPHELDATKRMMKGESFVRPEKVNQGGLLNLQNGVLNMETGEFREHSPEFLSTIQSGVVYDPQAECLLWLWFLAEILDEDRQKLLQEAFGYCLTTSIAFHVALFLVGIGANGKSVVLETLEALVGTANCSALMLSDLKERFRLAELDGKLVNIVSEVGAKSLVDDARFKSIVAGDSQVGERKNEHPFKFRPFAKWVVACNSLPATKDRSYGYERRIVILPFDRVVPPEKRNPNLAKELIEHELSGILNWAIVGYQRLKKQGRFTIPAASKAALEDYKEMIDPFLIFKKDHLQRADHGGLYLKTLYEFYRNWAENNGYKPVSSIHLRKAIESAFNVKAKKAKEGQWLPVVVTNRGETVMGQ